jgi:hypothetical protein
MKRLRWQLRKLAIRNPRLGNVEGNRLPQHGTSVLTATHVLEDTLSSIILYTHWRLHCLTGFQHCLKHYFRMALMQD